MFMIQKGSLAGFQEVFVIFRLSVGTHLVSASFLPSSSVLQWMLSPKPAGGKELMSTAALCNWYYISTAGWVCPIYSIDRKKGEKKKKWMLVS